MARGGKANSCVLELVFAEWKRVEKGGPGVPHLVGPSGRGTTKAHTNTGRTRWRDVGVHGEKGDGQSTR